MRVKAFPGVPPPETCAGVVVGPGVAAEPPPPRSGLAIRPKFIGLEVFWATYADIEMASTQTCRYSAYPAPAPVAL